MSREAPHILVTGSHRSGTTWVGRTIAQMPGVRYVQEPFSVDFPGHEMTLRLRHWFAHFESSPQQDEIRKAFDDLFHPTAFRYAWLRFRRAPRGVERIGRFFSEVLSPPEQPRVLVKDPIAMFSAGWLHETYGLKVVCMIRNPFAFVGSVKKAGWDFDFDVLASQEALMKGQLAPWAESIQAARDRTTGDFLDRACLIWNVIHHAIADYAERYPDWLFVRHEDLALDPVRGFRAMFEYLEMEFDDGIRNYIEEFTAEKNPDTTNSNQYSPRDSRKSLETWRKRLGDEDIARIGAATRELGLRFYGDHEEELPF